MSVLDWVDRAANVGDEGLERVRQAGADECAAIAEALAIPACRNLEASYRLTQLARGRVLMTGRIRAVLVRTCVVELEDFEQVLEEPIEIEFWPEAQIEGARARPLAAQTSSASDREIAVDALEGEDPEPISNGRIDVGAVIYQFLAAALDPFPRMPGAALETVEAAAPAAEERQNPFAALRALKPPNDQDKT